MDSLREETENAIRPTRWGDYIGQERVKRQLQVRADAAIERDEPMKHGLLLGPPGSGKTSLAKLVASYFGDEFRSYMMPVTTRVLEELVGYFSGVVLLDELHLLSKELQHRLLPLIEDGYYLDGRGRRYDAEWLTVFGATTEPKGVIKPLRDRFVPIRWDDYTDDEMMEIVQGMATRLGVDLPDDAAHGFAAASNGVPRQAAHLVQAWADLELAEPGAPAVDEVLRFTRIEPDGLTEDQLRYLMTFKDYGPTIGERTLGTVLGCGPGDLTEIEEVLVKKGYVEYSERGRSLTRDGRRRVVGESRGVLTSPADAQTGDGRHVITKRQR